MELCVKIVVDILVKEKYRYNFEKDIRDALTVIPRQHLVKLSKIVVQYEPPFHNADAMGSYFGIREGVNEPYILICAKNLMSCFPNGIPVVSRIAYRLYLRDTLYHEIAHHYQRLIHGIKKEEWEKNANLYSKYMQRLKYKESWMGKLLFGLNRIVRKRK